MLDHAAGPSLFDDLRTLRSLLFARVRGETHADRLESFYASQARGYDSFRRRMLHGRRELIESLDVPGGGVWVDLGAGTGENLEYRAADVAGLLAVHLVDLSPSLLAVASKRVEAHGWSNIRIAETDATIFDPGQPVDIVTLSYSLTMIPDWFRAVDNAWRMLKPGGVIGVVDFYVSRKHTSTGQTQHAWPTRTGWPTWFAADNVHLSGDHLPYLQSRFETVSLAECRGKVPYLPLVRVPSYRFIGRKRDAAVAPSQR
jgi:S-adenosylmethionine-diacylgycerolhomoserine-N-methlytransferase